MPSHKIHLGIAQGVNKKLNLDNDSIMLGSILPDITREQNHGLSHFQYDYIYPKNLANPDEFMKKYPNMKDDISIGYIIHLLTDRYYNDVYYHTNIEGIEHNRNFKHNLFASYDTYLLKHKKIEKFKNINVINNLSSYKDISFNKKYLKEYIEKTNNDIDNNQLDNNYYIEHQEFLDKLYKGCIDYIKDNINNYR